MYGMEHGFCPNCRTKHEVGSPGMLRNCGALCSLAVLVRSRRPDLAAALMAVSLVFGDAFEQWLTARCPVCGSALRVAVAIRRTY